MQRRWTVEDAVSLYGIDRWGGGYFSVNPEGHVTVDPIGSGSPNTIDIKDLIDDLKTRGIPFFVMLRFQDILRHRVRSLNTCFKNSIREYNYSGEYYGVFPIKVNQLREVVEEIVDAGQGYHFGLEAGSKPELIAALLTNSNKESVIICNGFKDREYIKTALYGKKLGHRVIIVIEKLSEIDTIFDIAEELGEHPEIGVRVKLYSKGSGRWEESSGDQAKFGLTTSDVLEAVKKLKAKGKLKSLVLTHFHIGSQITDIWKIKNAVRESTRVYAKMRKMRVPIEFMDVGGGLGVDYDGSRTNFQASVNYTMQEYTNDVVYNILEVCQAEEVPQPHIITESGRALSAHHAVLVVPVLDVDPIGGKTALTRPKVAAKDAQVIKELLHILQSISAKNYRESLHDAMAYKEEAFNLFNLGYLSLNDRSRAEQLFFNICNKVQRQSSGRKYIPEEIRDLEGYLADKYYCSFSIFQSCPDFWAVDHLFPIVPLHKLEKRPNRKGILVDITCDSDGKMDRFIDLHDIRSTLDLHSLKDDEDYYIGIFLVGAYQDAMGDLHNLFGRVNEVHVFSDPKEGYYVEKIITGDTASMVLDRVQYKESELISDLARMLDERVNQQGITYKDREEVLDHFQRTLQSYTYIAP
jgi:arginine decarboxylase